MANEISDRTLRILEAAAQLRTIRQNVITSNIANAETPGFKAKRVGFEQALQRAIDLDDKRNMNSTSSNHFSTGGGGVEGVGPEVYDDPNGVISGDGNTVDRATEEARLAETQIMYDATINLINRKLAMMKYAISEGSK